VSIMSCNNYIANANKIIICSLIKEPVALCPKIKILLNLVSVNLILSTWQHGICRLSFSNVMPDT
jgi:hypothetical protein